MGVTKYDLIVIGGGISGLSLAHYSAKASLRTLLIEKAPELGGCIRTSRQPAGYWFELGAHTCYNSYENLVGIIEDCGLRGKIQPRMKVPFLMLVDGRIKSIPSELDFFELFCSAPRIFTTSKSGMTVEAYYSKITGKRNFKKVLGPALNAVPSQRANDFPADMLFKKRRRRKDILKKFTVEGGLQTIAEAVVSAGKIEALTGTEAESLAFENNFFKISAGGREFASDSVGLAVPPPAASVLLKDLLPDAAALLSKIKAATVESVGIVTKKQNVDLPLFAGLIPVSDSFFSVVSRDTVSDETYRGFTFHFKPGIAHEEKMRRIVEVLGTDQFQAVSTNSATLPSPTLGNQGIINELDARLSGSRVLLTGNFFSGLAIEDCINRSSREFQRLINTK